MTSPFPRRVQRSSTPVAVLLVVALTVTAAALLLPSAQAQAPGWRMVDRFAGFRFEVVEPAGFDTQAFIDAAVAKADEFAAFGWIQHAVARQPDAVLVGEFRGNKRTAALYKEWLGDAAADGAVDVKDYEDTKIRYHFSHFKVLPVSRETCFEGPPHACNAGAGSSETEL